MTHRGRLLRAVLGSVMALGAMPVRSAYADSCDDARFALDRCEERLSSISCEIAGARQALDQASANQNAASSNLSAAVAQIEASRACIANSQNAIDSINRELSSLRDRASFANADYQAAKSRADAAAAEVARYQDAARATFEASPAYLGVMKDLDTAKADANAEIDDTLDWLRSTADYALLYDRIDDLEENLEAQRNRLPADPAALAAASNQWMDAKSELERFKATAVNADPWVRAARQRVESIDHARQDLLARFNQDLSNDPNLKNLFAAQISAQQSAQQAAASANAAASDVANREQELARLSNVIATEQQRLAQAQSDADVFQAQANQAAWDVANADAVLRSLWEREFCFRRERECCAEKWRTELACRDLERRHYRDGRDREHDRHPTDDRGHEVVARYDGNTRLTDQFSSRQRLNPVALPPARLVDRHEQREQPAQPLASAVPMGPFQSVAQPQPVIVNPSPTPKPVERAPLTPQFISPAIREAKFVGPQPVARITEPEQRISRITDEPRHAKPQPEQQAQPRVDRDEQTARDSRANQERERRDSQIRAERERQQRDANTRAAQENQERESHARAEQDRQQRESQAQSRAEHERQQRESQSRAEQEHQQREQAQARAEQDRQQREASREQDRQQREAAAREQEQRQQQSQQRQSDDDSQSHSHRHGH